MSDEITSQGPERSGINRRTVMKGAAWSVPVVLVASAAPAMASSRPIEITGVALSCKHPGEGGSNDYPKGYHILFNFKNTSNEAITFTLPGWVLTNAGDHLTSDPAQVPNSGETSPGNPISDIVIPANTASKQWVVHYYSNNSSALTIFMTYSYAGSTLSGTITDQFSIIGNTCQSQGVSNQHPCSSVTVPACSPTP